MLTTTKLLLEVIGLTKALRNDTNLFPLSVVVTAMPSGVLEVAVRKSDGHPLEQTRRAAQACINKFSKVRQTSTPDQALRKRRPGGGGAIVQLANPTGALRELAGLVGGTLSGGKALMSLTIEANSDEDVQQLFQSLRSV